MSKKSKKSKISKKIEKLCAKGKTAVLLAILVLIACFGLSWIVTCGIVKLITLCFGWTFTWGIATGIWLILCLLKANLKVTVKNE